jgi:schlafen family protein
MAKNDDLLERLNTKEDNFTERKPEGAGTNEFRKTIVAFANSLPDNQTGVLFIGVLDDGTVAGVSGADSVQKTIRKICETDCYPPIKPSCAVLKVGGKDVVAVEISASNQRPHFAGPAFVRVGSESKAATAELYQELLTSHSNPAGQLLKLKNQIVTVWAINKVLGNPRPVPSEIFSREYECQITAVTPTYVSLMDLASNINYSEPLGNIELTKDELKHRAMLIIRPK